MVSLELSLTKYRNVFKYILHSEYPEGAREWCDPYSFLPSVSNLDLQGFNAGWDRKPYERLGAIPRTIEGVKGVGFVVWAPSANQFIWLEILIIGIIRHSLCALREFRLQGNICPLCKSW